MGGARVVSTVDRLFAGRDFKGLVVGVRDLLTVARSSD
jgi:hypothetical protein